MLKYIIIKSNGRLAQFTFSNIKFRNANYGIIYLKIFFALSVLINATLIVFANVGDSRAILIRKNIPYFTTEAKWFKIF